jgi:hypothetical protein
VLELLAFPSLPLRVVLITSWQQNASVGSAALLLLPLQENTCHESSHQMLWGT